jgi:hypothetical protein
MADYIYDAQGRPHGFRLGANIYTMDGKAVGRVWAEKAYTLDGAYVGAILKDMIVVRENVSRRRLPPVSAPEDAAPPPNPGNRRPILDGFEDAFPLLTEPVEEEAGSAL